jgi:Cdc6-like AAA superfamily ATPase
MFNWNALKSVRSSSSVSLLPSCPKIFHGREAELQHVVKALLHSYPACIAILGTAGIGKTTLATAALHEPDVRGKYNNIFFVSCESAESPSALVVAIASKMGIQQSGSLENAILRKLTGSDPTLLVLDNLETPWEPLQFRNACEELLSKLTDIANLSLLVCRTNILLGDAILLGMPLILVPNR